MRRRFVAWATQDGNAFDLLDRIAEIILIGILVWVGCVVFLILGGR
jgi:hypothetical protein